MTKIKCIRINGQKTILCFNFKTVMPHGFIVVLCIGTNKFAGSDGFYFNTGGQMWSLLAKERLCSLPWEYTGCLHAQQHLPHSSSVTALIWSELF